MPHLTISRQARSGIQRCLSFLTVRNASASLSASQAIGRRLSLLATSPEIGRTVPESPILRELVITHGSSGYLALYTFDPVTDVVLVLAFRHQREAEY